MENKLQPNNAEEKKLIEREKELRQKLLEQGEKPETIEAIIAKTREAYTEEVLRHQEYNFPQPLFETHKLNREIWNDGVVTDAEMDSLIKNQNKLQFNFMIMRDLMNHLEKTGDYTQNGRLYEVRDKFERLRKAVRVNETSISRAHRTRKENRKTKKDNSIILNLRSHELSLVQGILRSVQNGSQQIQAQQQIEYANIHGAQKIR